MSDAFDWERHEAELSAADNGFDWERYEAEFIDQPPPPDGDLLLSARGGGCGLIDGVDWGRYEAELISSADADDVDALRLWRLENNIVVLGGPAGIGKSALLARLYLRQFAEAANTNPELAGVEFSHRQLALFLLRRVDCDLSHATVGELLAAAALITSADVVVFLSRLRAAAMGRRQPYPSPPQPSRPPGRLVARSRRPPRGPNRVQAPTAVLPGRGKFAAA